MQTGKVYRIPCDNYPGIIYCKTMPWKIDNFYILPESSKVDDINFGNLDYFYANWVNISVYKELDFIRKEPITDKERNSIPKFFRQSHYDMYNCKIVIPGQIEAVLCAPEDCIGLDREVIHDSLLSLCERLVIKLTGKQGEDYNFIRLRIPGVDKPIDFNNWRS